MFKNEFKDITNELVEEVSRALDSDNADKWTEKDHPDCFDRLIEGVVSSCGNHGAAAGGVPALTSSKTDWRDYKMAAIKDIIEDIMVKRSINISIPIVKNIEEIAQDLPTLLLFKFGIKSELNINISFTSAANVVVLSIENNDIDENLKIKISSFIESFTQGYEGKLELEFD